MSDFLLLESDDDESNDYAESEVPEIEDGEPEVSAKKRRGKFEYESLKTLTTKEELEEYQQLIKSEGMHRKHEFNGVYERIYTYECKETRRGCKYVLIIRSPHDSSKSTVSHRVCGHDHSNSKLMKQIKEFLSSNSETNPVEDGGQDAPSTSTQNVVPKRRRVKYDYEDVKVIASLEELEEYQQLLKAEGLHKKSQFDGGWEKIVTYECREARRGCKYVLIIRTSHDDSISRVSHRICGHDHFNAKLMQQIKDFLSVQSEIDGSAGDVTVSGDNAWNDDDTASTSEMSPAKKRRIKYEYEDIKTLLNLEELAEYQQLLKAQGLHKKSQFDGGWENIITYECKEAKRGCKYVLIVRTSHDDSKSTVSHRLCGHDHSNPKNSETNRSPNLNTNTSRCKLLLKDNGASFYRILPYPQKNANEVVAEAEPASNPRKRRIKFEYEEYKTLSSLEELAVYQQFLKAEGLYKKGEVFGAAETVYTYECKEARYGCRYGLVIRTGYHDSKSTISRRKFGHDHSQCKKKIKLSTAKKSDITKEIQRLVTAQLNGDEGADDLSALNSRLEQMTSADGNDDPAKKRFKYAYEEIKLLSNLGELSEYQKTLKDRGLHKRKETVGILENIMTYECKAAKKGCKYTLIVRTSHESFKSSVSHRTCGHNHPEFKQSETTSEVMPAENDAVVNEDAGAASYSEEPRVNESAETEPCENDEFDVITKQRRVKYDYEEIKTLSNLEELEEYLQSLKTFGLHKKNEVNGVWEKIYTFECKETIRGCKYALIIRTAHDNLKSIVNHRTCGHDHSHLNSPNAEIATQIEALLSVHSETTDNSNEYYEDLLPASSTQPQEYPPQQPQGYPVLLSQEYPTHQPQEYPFDQSVEYPFQHSEEYPHQYESNQFYETESYENDRPTSSNKKGRIQYEYEEIKTLSSLEELKEYEESLKAEGCRKKSAFNGVWKKVITYECKEANRGCKFAVIIKTAHDDPKSTVSQRICGHDHSNLFIKQIKEILTAEADEEEEYESEAESTHSEDYPKKKRTTFKYEDIKVLSTLEELEKFQQTLKPQGLHKKSEFDGKEEKIYTYECKEMKRKCKYSLIIRTSYETNVSTVCHRTCGHDHSKAKTSELTKEIRDFMYKIISEHSYFPANRMQIKLKEAGLTVLPRIQIRNFVKRERQKMKQRKDAAAAANVNKEGS